MEGLDEYLIDDFFGDSRSKPTPDVPWMKPTVNTSTQQHGVSSSRQQQQQSSRIDHIDFLDTPSIRKPEPELPWLKSTNERSTLKSSVSTTLDFGTRATSFYETQNKPESVIGTESLSTSLGKAFLESSYQNTYLETPSTTGDAFKKQPTKYVIEPFDEHEFEPAYRSKINKASISSFKLPEILLANDDARESNGRDVFGSSIKTPKLSTGGSDVNSFESIFNKVPGSRQESVCEPQSAIIVNEPVYKSTVDSSKLSGSESSNIAAYAPSWNKEHLLSAVEPTLVTDSEAAFRKLYDATMNKSLGERTETLPQQSWMSSADTSAPVVDVAAFGRPQIPPYQLQNNPLLESALSRGYRLPEAHMSSADSSAPVVDVTAFGRPQIPPSQLQNKPLLESALSHEYRLPEAHKSDATMKPKCDSQNAVEGEISNTNQEISTQNSPCENPYLQVYDMFKTSASELMIKPAYDKPVIEKTANESTYKPTNGKYPLETTYIPTFEKPVNDRSSNTDNKVFDDDCSHMPTNEKPGYKSTENANAGKTSYEVAYQTASGKSSSEPAMNTTPDTPAHEPKCEPLSGQYNYKAAYKPSSETAINEPQQRQSNPSRSRKAKFENSRSPMQPPQHPPCQVIRASVSAGKAIAIPAGNEPQYTQLQSHGVEHPRTAVDDQHFGNPKSMKIDHRLSRSAVRQLTTPGLRDSNSVDRTKQSRHGKDETSQVKSLSSENINDSSDDSQINSFRSESTDTSVDSGVIKIKTTSFDGNHSLKDAREPLSIVGQLDHDTEGRRRANDSRCVKLSMSTVESTSPAFNITDRDLPMKRSRSQTDTTKAVARQETLNPRTKRNVSRESKCNTAASYAHESNVKPITRKSNGQVVILKDEPTEARIKKRKKKASTHTCNDAEARTIPPETHLDNTKQQDESILQMVLDVLGKMGISVPWSIAYPRKYDPPPPMRHGPFNHSRLPCGYNKSEVAMQIEAIAREHLWNRLPHLPKTVQKHDDHKHIDEIIRNILLAYISQGSGKARTGPIHVNDGAVGDNEQPRTTYTPINGQQQNGECTARAAKDAAVTDDEDDILEQAERTRNKCRQRREDARKRSKTTASSEIYEKKKRDKSLTSVNRIKPDPLVTSRLIVYKLKQVVDESGHKEPRSKCVTNVLSSTGFCEKVKDVVVEQNHRVKKHTASEQDEARVKRRRQSSCMYPTSSSESDTSDESDDFIEDKDDPADYNRNAANNNNPSCRSGQDDDCSTDHISSEIAPKSTLDVDSEQDNTDCQQDYSDSSSNSTSYYDNSMDMKDTIHPNKEAKKAKPGFFARLKDRFRKIFKIKKVRK